MTLSPINTLLSQTNRWLKIVNYEVITGNAIWRFALVLLVILVALASGRIAQYALAGYSRRQRERKGVTLITLLCDSLIKPIYVAIFASGVFLAKAPLRFDEMQGISPTIDAAWAKIAQAVAAVAFAYALYRLVDIIEYYLKPRIILIVEVILIGAN